MSTAALANGRPPNSTLVRINPFDPNEWLLGATFGMLLSHDGGASFEWLCEQAVDGPAGFSGADPVPLWFGPGRLVLAVFDNMALTTDGGCSWSAAPASIGGLFVNDLTGHPADANTWFVSGVDPNTNMGQIFATHDAGATYAALSLAVPNVGWQSVRVATPDGQRMLAAGWGINDFKGPYLALSADAGATWRHTLISGGADAISGPQLLVNPVDPNALLIASVDATTNASVVQRIDATTAVGTVVATLSDGFRGGVFSADGKTVWIATHTRVLRSTDGGASFTPLANPQSNACIELEGSTLYACGNDAKDLFALASSADGGTTWSPKFTLAQTHGPLACAASSDTQNVCPELWPNTASAIGIKSNASGPAGDGNTKASVGAKPAAGKQGCSCAGAGAGGGWALAVVAAYVRMRQRSCNTLCSGVR